MKLESKYCIVSRPEDTNIDSEKQHLNKLKLKYRQIGRTICYSK